MILVDSSVWIDYFNGKKSWQTNRLDNLLSETPVLMGDLILTEVLHGFKSDKDYRNARSYLSVLPFDQMGGYEIAVKSAQNYRRLRKKGVTVRKTIDIIIATFCIENNHALLHDDRDFDAMSTHLALEVVTNFLP